MTRAEWYEARRQARLGHVAPLKVMLTVRASDLGVKRMSHFAAVLRHDTFNARWAWIWSLGSAGRRRVCPRWPYGELEWAKRRG